jgi:hypothetical protein
MFRNGGTRSFEDELHMRSSNNQGMSMSEALRNYVGGGGRGDELDGRGPIFGRPMPSAAAGGMVPPPPRAVPPPPIMPHSARWAAGGGGGAAMGMPPPPLRDLEEGHHGNGEMLFEKARMKLFRR